ILQPLIHPLPQSKKGSLTNSTIACDDDPIHRKEDIPSRSFKSSSTKAAEQQKRIRSCSSSDLTIAL
ncbi:MAG: hypothetical protein VZR32_08045, partial [Candidatus Weimeria sp.]|nr:hypothetical protein [Candidatus Weimeria sp.]